MPLPASINDLSTTAASNSPAGSEPSGTADDYLRYYAAYIAQLRDGAAFSGSLKSNTLGSTGAPAFTFTADTNTGFWSPGADSLGMSVGGTQYFHLNSSGNFGFGTSSPSVKIDAYNASAAVEVRAQSGASASAGIGLRNTDRYWQLSVQPGGAMIVYDSTAAQTRLSLDGSGNLTINNTSAAPSTPTGGGVLYVESGVLKYRGPSGTITLVGAA